MKAKIIILTPVFNDWKNLTKLLAKINIILKKNLDKDLIWLLSTIVQLRILIIKNLKMVKLIS